MPSKKELDEQLRLCQITLLDRLADIRRMTGELHECHRVIELKEGRETHLYDTIDRLNDRNNRLRAHIVRSIENG